MRSAELFQHTACWDQGQAAETHHLPLILIHGLGLDHHCFDGMVPALAQSHRVITFDLAAGVKELIKPQPPITCPSLVMTCEHDSGSTVAMSAAIATEIAPSETVIIPHLQHLGLIEAPSLFHDAIIRLLKAFHQVIDFAKTLIDRLLVFV